MLTIVVVILTTARAPQIVLNLLMVAFLDVSCRTLPTDRCYCPCRIEFRAGGRTPCAPEMAEAAWMRYAASADSCTRIPLQRDGRRLAKGSAIGHRKAPELQELMISGDFGDAHC
jgi:hypothetical protein